METQVYTRVLTLYGTQRVHDSPGAGSLELQPLVVSQSQQTDSRISEESASQMKWKTSVYPVGTWSIKNEYLQVMKIVSNCKLNCCAH